MRILREDTAAILIDVQDRLVPVVNGSAEIVATTARLIKGLHILEVPIIPVRQYPRGLGELTAELRAALGEHTPTDKLTFSVWDTPELAERIRACGKKNLLVFGMESHICVLQSVVDLIEGGFNAVLVTDCIGSRFPRDHEMALRRAQAEGAVLTTSESILFEMLRKAGTDTFKQISALVK